MEALEEDEDLGDADGWGDLEEDFVLAATDVGAGAAGAAGPDGCYESDQVSDVESYDEEEEEGEEGGSSYSGSGSGGAPGGSQAGPGGRAPARPGSIASTYWREERTDRKNLLTVIDEK